MWPTERGDGSWGGGPSAAECLDEEHTGRQPPRQDRRRRAAVGQGGALRREHLEIARHAAAVAIRRERERAVRRRDRRRLDGRFLTQDAERREAVLDVLQ